MRLGRVQVHQLVQVGALNVCMYGGGEAGVRLGRVQVRVRPGNRVRLSRVPIALPSTLLLMLEVLPPSRPTYSPPEWAIQHELLLRYFPCIPTAGGYDEYTREHPACHEVAKPLSRTYVIVPGHHECPRVSVSINELPGVSVGVPSNTVSWTWLPLGVQECQQLWA